MPQFHETRTGFEFIERVKEALPAITKALEKIASREDSATQGFNPRELFLLLEAVEYYVAEIKTENDAEFATLLARLIVMTGRARATQ